MEDLKASSAACAFPTAACSVGGSVSSCGRVEGSISSSIPVMSVAWTGSSLSTSKKSFSPSFSVSSVSDDESLTQVSTRCSLSVFRARFTCSSNNVGSEQSFKTASLCCSSSIPVEEREVHGDIIHRQSQML